MRYNFVAAFGDKYVVFKAAASEFFVVESRFKRYDHARFKNEGFGCFEINARRFMYFKTDRMSETVRHFPFFSSKYFVGFERRIAD